MGEFYENYIDSAQWHELRKKIIELDGFCCRKCGSDKRLEVHHKNYRRLGNEDVNDLITLCHICHDKQTQRDRKKKIKKSMLRSKYGII